MLIRSQFVFKCTTHLRLSHNNVKTNLLEIEDAGGGQDVLNVPGTHRYLTGVAVVYYSLKRVTIDTCNQQ